MVSPPLKAWPLTSKQHNGKPRRSRGFLLPFLVTENDGLVFLFRHRFNTGDLHTSVRVHRTGDLQLHDRASPAMGNACIQL